MFKKESVEFFNKILQLLSYKNNILVQFLENKTLNYYNLYKKIDKNSRGFIIPLDLQIFCQSYNKKLEIIRAQHIILEISQKKLFCNYEQFLKYFTRIDKKKGAEKLIEKENVFFSCKKNFEDFADFLLYLGEIFFWKKKEIKQMRNKYGFFINQLYGIFESENEYLNFKTIFIIFEEFGYTLTKEKFSVLTKFSDLDKDGKISKKEFIKFFLIIEDFDEFKENNNFEKITNFKNLKTKKFLDNYILKKDKEKLLFEKNIISEKKQKNFLEKEQTFKHLNKFIKKYDI